MSNENIKTSTRRAAEQSAEERERSEDSSGGRGNSGRGWHGDPEGHAAAGSKGGQKVSQNRDHMASIGRKGGQSVSRDRQHMAEIGRKGGQARGEPGQDDRDDDNHTERK